MLDDQTAAEVRFTHRIPTIFPKSMTRLLHLDQQCTWCGRPWQANTEGACEHCPQVMFGATPNSGEDALRMLAGEPAGRGKAIEQPAADDDDPTEQYRRMRNEHDAVQRASASRLAREELHRGAGANTQAEDIAAVPIYAGEMMALRAIVQWLPKAAGEPYTQVVESLFRDLFARWETAAGHHPDGAAPDGGPSADLVAAADRHASARALVQESVTSAAARIAAIRARRTTTGESYSAAAAALDSRDEQEW